MSFIGKLNLATLGLLCVTACSTTGDPTKGGLIGWSEKKATVRRDILQDRADDTQEEVDAVTQQNDSLESDVDALNSDVRTLEIVLKQLTQENEELRTTFDQLVKRSEKAKTEHSALSRELQITGNRFNVAPLGEDAAKQRAKHVDAQNRRLHTAILLLLKQR